MPNARLQAATLSFLLPLCSISQTPSPQSPITGTWRGTSDCAVKNSSCHDEINVYRFSEITGKPGWFSGDGSKIVDGKEISMGTLEWSYDAATHTLKSENSGRTFRLVIDGDTIEGTLTMPYNTVFRRIHLKKEN